MVDDGRFGDDAYADTGEGEGDDEEWFGEGSAFDSGEDLAAALFSMAGVSMPGEAEAESAAETAHEPVFESTRPGPAGGASSGATTQVTVGSETFQVVERPGASAPAPASEAAAPAWSVRPQVPGTTRTSWGMRHSVQFLKMTEEVMKKLRNEAIELTWQVAALAVEQGNAVER